MPIAAARAEPDGYALLMTLSSLAVLPEADRLFERSCLRGLAVHADRARARPSYVPFRGAGPALTALLSGTVQAIAAAPGTLKPQVDDGKLRVLGNCGAQRIASFPDVPTFQELGYKDVEMYIWAGLFAQRALPAPIAMRLREAMA